MRTFLQVGSVGLTMLASFFLIKGSLFMSARCIAEISTPRYNFHPEVARNFVIQHINTKIGFIFTLLAFILQAINLKPMTIDDFAFSETGRNWAISMSAVLFIVAFFCGKILSKNLLKKVAEENKKLLQK